MWSIYTPFQDFCSYTNFGHNGRVTAIANVYTKDGFVIGADGRRMDKLADGTARIDTEQAQKIFSFKRDSVFLAWAWTGLTRGFGQNDCLVFDLPEVSERILSSPIFPQQDFNSFLCVFCNRLSTTLAETPFSRGPLQSDPEVARVIFAGFFNGKPCTATVRVLELTLGTVFAAPQKVHIPAQFHKSVFSGGERVYELFKDQTPRTGSEAIDFVHKYIEACANSSDEDCIGIGGHIHIASITQDGFDWIIPPQISN